MYVCIYYNFQDKRQKSIFDLHAKMCKYVNFNSNNFHTSQSEIWKLLNVGHDSIIWIDRVHVHAGIGIWHKKNKSNVGTLNYCQQFICVIIQQYCFHLLWLFHTILVAFLLFFMDFIRYYNPLTNALLNAIF